ncbi:MAG TPA: tetratricopeptide repeat protein, partial [Edaphocola sp.]|nr:tetratricopeptide repeat protein [Edaphocola sp.]
MKIKAFLLLLPILIIGCSQKKLDDNNYFLRYDNSELDNNHKEELLDSLYYHFSAQSNDSVNRYALFKVASRYENLDLETKYFNTVDKIHEWALEKNDTLDIAKSLWYKGDFHDAKESYDSAFHYYSQSEKLYRSSKKDSLNWGRMLLYKAGVLYDTGIYTESEAEAVKALTVLSSVKHNWFIYRANLQMAINLKELKEYEDALKYYYAVFAQLNELKKEDISKDRLDNSYSTYYNNIGGLYDEMGEYDQGKHYYSKGLAFEGLKDNPKLHAMLLNNYAYNKMQSGDSRQVDSLLFLSLRIRDSINHEQGIIASKIRISEYYLGKK